MIRYYFLLCLTEKNIIKSFLSSTILTFLGEALIGYTVYCFVVVIILVGIVFKIIGSLFLVRLFYSFLENCNIY